MNDQNRNQREVEILIGTVLCGHRIENNIRRFLFRASTSLPSEKKAVTLRLMCPWRFESGDQIITGSADWFEHEDPNRFDASWDPVQGRSLQNARLREFFGGSDSEGYLTDSGKSLLSVTAVSCGELGDLVVTLGGFGILKVFPAGSREHFWRLEKDKEFLLFEFGPREIGPR